MHTWCANVTVPALALQTYTHLIVFHAIIAWLDTYGIGELLCWPAAVIYETIN